MDKIGKLLQSRLDKAQKTDPHLHHEMHILADEISTAFGERKRFAMYLGTIKRVGMTRARAVYRQIQQDGGAKQPGRLFMYLCKESKSEKTNDDGHGDGHHEKGNPGTA